MEQVSVSPMSGSLTSGNQVFWCVLVGAVVRHIEGRRRRVATTASGWAIYDEPICDHKLVGDQTYPAHDGGYGHCGMVIKAASEDLEGRCNPHP